jgi:hypothetical protein
LKVTGGGIRFEVPFYLNDLIGNIVLIKYSCLPTGIVKRQKAQEGRHNQCCYAGTTNTCYAGITAKKMAGSSGKELPAIRILPVKE